MRYRISPRGFMSVSVTAAEIKELQPGLELKNGLFACRTLTRNECDLIRINQGKIKCLVQMEKGARAVLQFQIIPRMTSEMESPR